MLTRERKHFRMLSPRINCLREAIYIYVYHNPAGFSYSWTTIAVDNSSIDYAARRQADNMHKTVNQQSIGPQVKTKNN